MGEVEGFMMEIENFDTAIATLEADIEDLINENKIAGMS